jgi:hypothetical protein
MMKLSVPFYRFAFYEGIQSVGIASYWKAAMEICGRPAGGVKPPQRPITNNQKNKLKEILMKAGLV